MEDSVEEILAEPDEPVASSGFLSILTNIEYIFATYGWFIVGALFVLFYFKDKILTNLKNTRRQTALITFGPTVADESHMDVETFIARQEAMEAARKRMQEAYSAKAAEFAAKQKEKEEAKRQEKLQDWEKHEQGLGYRSKVKPKEEPTAEQALKPKPVKPKLKPEYNPLMGEGSSGVCFRPSRRGGAAGG